MTVPVVFLRGARPPFVGYSMGEYVALSLARHHPTRVTRMFTPSTKL